MAPRPVTPSQHQTSRSASAPNSPARHTPTRGFMMFGSGRSSPHHHPFPPQIDRTNSGGSAGGGIIPPFPINRLPSQDSLDRSIHNESGHGRSTAQIIKDLKSSNANFSAKIASLEKRHMNELAPVEAKRKELEVANEIQRKKLMQYDNYKLAAEAKMKQQHSELTKIKEESAFQRHNISDLKSQLYQLQQIIDERDEEDESMLGDDDDDEEDDHDLRRPHSGNGHNLPLHPSHNRSNSNSGLDIAPTSSSMSTEDLQQMALDNEELVKEIQELQDRLMEYQGYDKKLKDLQRQLEAAQRNTNGSDAGIPPRPTTPTHPLQKNQPERDRPPLAPSKSRDQDEIQQLQDTKGELEAHTQKLLQWESTVRDMKAEKLALADSHEQRVQELEDRYLDLEEECKERELLLKEELEAEAQAQQEQIAGLEERLEEYAEKLADVVATLAESRQQAKNQEQYRKDEAEDLRCIQDSHEEEIKRLKKELDEATRELELRDEELGEIKQKYMSLLQQQEKEDEKKMEETETKRSTTSVDGAELEQPSDSNSKLISTLEEELYNSANTVNTLELQLEDLRKERDETVAILEADKAKLSSDLNAAGVEKGQDSHTSDLHKLWEEKTSKTQEVESLRKEIEDMRQRVQDSTEAVRLANLKVQDSEKQLEDRQSDAASKNLDSNELAEKLKLAQRQVVDSNEEIASLKNMVEELNFLSSENVNTKEQLREAQMALVALDDDKHALYDEFNEMKSLMENERENIENEMKAQMDIKEAELVELRKIKNIIGPLEAEKFRLEEEVQNMKNDKKSNPGDDSQRISSRSVPDGKEDFRKDLERQIEGLEDERSIINSKLKDRDTTIATLLRSSIVLEKKIETLQKDLREAKDKQEKTGNELKELEITVSSHNEDYSKVCEDIKYLEGELKKAKTEAKRWERSLKKVGTRDEYRYQIAMLQKKNEDYAETVLERDQAIQNLVNQSMGQEQHIRDLKIRISSLMKEVESVRMNKGRNDESTLRAEIDRLQEESEIFAGQIIEQDEEFKRMQRVLRKREEEISLMKAKIENMQETVVPDDYAIQDRDRQISELQKNIESLESQESSDTVVIDPIEMKNLQAELDEMQEASESNRIELRDLRQQLWEAKEAAGSANDLRVQLEQAKWEFDEYKRNGTSKQLSNEDVELRIELDKALSRIEELEVLLAENPVIETKLNDLGTELQTRETVIQELREQLSNVCSDSEPLNRALDIKNKESERQLQSKGDEVRILNQELSASRSEMGDVRDLLKSKTDMVTELNEEVKILTEEISEIQGQLQASVSTATDLAVQTKASQEEADAMREVVEATAESVNSLTEKLSTLQNEVAVLRTTGGEKSGRIKQLEKEVSGLTRDINDSQHQLEVKTNTIEDLDQRLRANEAQLKEASDLKLKLGSDLADSQARLGALERELLNAITETSSNEELATKNQSLVQENASLAQKNKSLVEENASLESTNENLVEESETLTNDNQILCLELKTLGEQNNSLSEAKENIEQDFESLTIEKQSLERLNNAIRRENEERVTSLGGNASELSKCNDSLREEVASLSTFVQELRDENKSIVNEKNSSEKEIASLIENVEGEKHHLKQKMDTLLQANDSLTKDNRALVEENNALTETVGSLTEKNKSVAEKGVEMGKEIETLKADMEMLSEGSSNLEVLKIQLEEARKHREETEQAIIKNYEKQMISLSSSKDMEMDSLRNSLTESREKNSETMGDMIAQLKNMEQENSDLTQQFELEMQAKEQQIFALEQTLHAQEQIVDTMRSEMDQIQSGMEHATMARRGEVEEMQQEVMQTEEKAMKQEREIVSLKMLLEERKLEHKADVVKLKDALAKAMEQDSPLKKTICDLQNNDRMLEVRERLEQLKKRNTDLQEENLNLGGRLERAAIQINAFELEKQQAEEIEEENMKLRKQLKEYEQILSKSAKSSRNAPAPQSSTSEKEATMKIKDKKKKKFGLFKRRGTDGSISEVKEEDEL